MKQNAATIPDQLSPFYPYHTDRLMRMIVPRQPHEGLSLEPTAFPSCTFRLKRYEGVEK